MGFIFFCSLDNKYYEAKGRVSERNNSIKLFYARQISVDLLPSGVNHFIETCNIEILHPIDSSRPDTDFFSLLNRLDSLQETKIVSLADRKKEVAIWEKYIKADKATNLRNYINEVESKAKSSSNNLSEEVKAWLEWARKKADWYNPFTEKEDDLLSRVDRETLTAIKKQSYYSW